MPGSMYLSARCTLQLVEDWLCAGLQKHQAAVIFKRAVATGGMATSSVEMMPMSEYARAQKGSASGSLQVQIASKRCCHWRQCTHDSSQMRSCKAKVDDVSGILTREARRQGAVA